MQNYFCLYLFIFKFAFFRFTECYENRFNLRKITNVENFHQITLFVSEDSSNIFDFKTFLFNEFPSVTYSFSSNNQEHSNKFIKISSKSQHSLQESLVIFYTRNINKTESFIDFLEVQLSVRKRPKCLITYASNNSEYKEDENILVDILKYAWKKNFLDFTIIVTNFEQKTLNFSSSLIYYFNPFNNCIYQEQLQDENIEIFPNKLRNGFGHPIYIS